MKKVTLLVVFAVFGATMMFAGCQKKGSAEKTIPATEHSEQDGHDHSSHEGHNH